MSDETIRPTEPTPEEGDNQETTQECVPVPEATEPTVEAAEDTPDEMTEISTEASAAAQAESAPEDTESGSAPEITPPCYHLPLDLR